MDYDSIWRIKVLGGRDELSSFHGRKRTSLLEVP